MISKKPLNFFFAIFIALGLLFSPFSMKHGYSSSKSKESFSTHCLDSDFMFSKKSQAHHEKKSDGHHSTDKSKSSTSCCVAACVAIIFPQTGVHFNLAFVKPELVISDVSPLFGKSLENLARPPKSLS